MPDTPIFISENGIYKMEPKTNDLTKISVTHMTTLTIPGFYWIKLKWEPTKWNICYIAEIENFSTSPYVEVFGYYIETLKELKEYIIELGPRIEPPTTGEPT